LKHAKSARDGGKRIRKIKVHLDDLGDDGLTNRQRLFIEAYLGPARLNASRAAKLAGYSVKSKVSLQVQGSRLLCNAMVQSRVRARLAGMGVDRELILERIGQLAGSSMADMLQPDEGGRIVLSLEKAAELGALGLIKKYREESGSEGVTIRTVEIHDPGKYLELLARHTGIIGDEGQEDPKSLNDDPANWPPEKVREFYQARGWPLPDALAPRPAAVGSGLVDEKGAAIVRQTILESHAGAKAESRKQKAETEGKAS
jgi:hypothetical protein